jgi:hypothetical protein
MKMPGCTAEASLSASNQHYQLIADKAPYLKRENPRNPRNGDGPRRWLIALERMVGWIKGGLA